MELFTLDNQQLVQLNAEWIQLHEPFRIIYQRDKGNADRVRRETGRFRLQAHREFTFIYLYQDYRSRLMNYPDEKRWKEAVKDSGLPENWEPDKQVKTALQHYKELQDCRELRLLKAAYNAIDIAIEQLTNVTIVEKETVELLEKIQKLIKNLEETEKMVKSSLQKSSSSRGDTEIGENEL